MQCVTDKWWLSVQNDFFSFLNELDSEGLFRFEAAVPIGEGLDWLAGQSFGPKLYWRDRFQYEEVAAVGVADFFESVWISELEIARIQERLLMAPGARYWGGFRFDEHVEPDSIWSDFGAGQLILPLFEWIRQGDERRLAVNVWIAPNEAVSDRVEAIKIAFKQLNMMPKSIGVGCYDGVERQDTPSYEDWIRQVEALTQLMTTEGLEKAVLSRQSTFRFSDRLCPFEILKRIQSADPHSYVFLYQPQPHICFLSGTPERLYFRDGRTVFSEALAGTVPRGETPEQDMELENVLRCSPHYQEEHQYVVEMVRQQLQRVCNQLSMGSKTTIKKLPLIQHLLVECQGVLSDSINDHDLLKILHPTPAVAGTPTQSALNIIGQFESHDRGWYAGPVGYIGLDRSEFIVAIRSGIV